MRISKLLDVKINQSTVGHQFSTVRAQIEPAAANTAQKVAQLV